MEHLKSFFPEKPNNSIPLLMPVGKSLISTGKDVFKLLKGRVFFQFYLFAFTQLNLIS